jgi:hypothetical protein
MVLGLALLVPMFNAQPQDAAAQNAEYYREVVFSQANVITADEAAPGIAGFSQATLGAFQITCVEDSGTATLDAAIQRSVDGGTTWADIVAFTQLAASGSETKLYADVRAASAQLIGDRLRAEFDVTGTGQYTCTAYGALEG